MDILFARQNSEEEEEEGQEREESAGAPFSEAGGADGGSRSWWLPYQEGDLLVAKMLAEYVSASTALKSLKCAARLLPCSALSAAADSARVL